MKPFNNNQGVGGFQQLNYQVPVVQPVESSWTRQLAQKIPEKPKLRRIVSVKDRYAWLCTFGYNTIIVKSPDEIIAADRDNKAFPPHTSRLHIVNSNGTVKDLCQIEKCGKGITSPVLGINGDLLVSTNYALGIQRYSLMSISKSYELKWEVELDKPPYHKPSIDGEGNIYVYTMTCETDNPASYKDGTLHCISMEGKVLWSKFFGRFIWHEPVIIKNNLLFFGVGADAFILDQKGEMVMKFPDLGGKSHGWYPVIDKSGIIYINSKDGFKAVDMHGNTIWNLKSSLGIATLNPAIDKDGLLYIPIVRDRLACVNSKDGSIKWIIDQKGQANKPPIIGDNGLLCCYGCKLGPKCTLSTIQILDENGCQVWDSDFFEGLVETIVPSGDGRLYVLAHTLHYARKSNGDDKCSWEIYEIS